MSEAKDYLEVFPLDSIISVEISGAFYSRLNQLFMEHANQRGLDKLAQTFVELNSREPQDSWEFHLLTLSILIREIEQNVRNENKFEKIHHDEIQSTLQKLAEDSLTDDPQSQSQPESQD